MFIGARRSVERRRHAAWRLRCIGVASRRTVRWALLLIGLGGAAFAATGGTTADHSKFESLRGPFAHVEAVTKACLGCRTEVAGRVKATPHRT